MIEYKLSRVDWGGLHSATSKIYDVLINGVKTYNLECVYWGKREKNEFKYKDKEKNYVQYYEGLRLPQVKKEFEEFYKNNILKTF
jgi:hypothetical protein